MPTLKSQTSPVTRFESLSVNGRTVIRGQEIDVERYGRVKFLSRTVHANGGEWIDVAARNGSLRSVYVNEVKVVHQIGKAKLK